MKSEHPSPFDHIQPLFEPPYKLGVVAPIEPEGKYVLGEEIDISELLRDPEWAQYEQYILTEIVKDETAKSFLQIIRDTQSIRQFVYATMLSASVHAATFAEVTLHPFRMSNIPEYVGAAIELFKFRKELRQEIEANPEFFDELDWAQLYIEFDKVNGLIDEAVAEQVTNNFNRTIEALTPIASDAEALLKEIGKQFGRYVPDAREISSLFIDLRDLDRSPAIDLAGNCDARAKLVHAVLSELRPDLPVLFEIFADHVQAVVEITPGHWVTIVGGGTLSQVDVTDQRRYFYSPEDIIRSFVGQEVQPAFDRPLGGGNGSVITIGRNSGPMGMYSLDSIFSGVPDSGPPFSDDRIIDAQPLSQYQSYIAEVGRSITEMVAVTEGQVQIQHLVDRTADVGAGEIPAEEDDFVVEVEPLPQIYLVWVPQTHEGLTILVLAGGTEANFSELGYTLEFIGNGMAVASTETPGEKFERLLTLLVEGHPHTVLRQQYMSEELFYDLFEHNPLLFVEHSTLYVPASIEQYEPLVRSMQGGIAASELHLVGTRPGGDARVLSELKDLISYITIESPAEGFIPPLDLPFRLQQDRVEIPRIAQDIEPALYMNEHTHWVPRGYEQPLLRTQSGLLIYNFLQQYQEGYGRFPRGEARTQFTIDSSDHSVKIDVLFSSDPNDVRNRIVSIALTADEIDSGLTFEIWSRQQSREYLYTQHEGSDDLYRHFIRYILLRQYVEREHLGGEIVLRESQLHWSLRNVNHPNTVFNEVIELNIGEFVLGIDVGTDFSALLELLDMKTVGDFPNLRTIVFNNPERIVIPSDLGITITDDRRALYGIEIP